MKDAGGQYSVLAILNKLTQMSQTSFFCLTVLFQYHDDGVHNCALVIKATL
jgi:hypothetical protein